MNTTQQCTGPCLRHSRRLPCQQLKEWRATSRPETTSVTLPPHIRALAHPEQPRYLHTVPTRGTCDLK